MGRRKQQTVANPARGGDRLGVRREVGLSALQTQEGQAPVSRPALRCLWDEEEKLGFPLFWGGTSLGEKWSTQSFLHGCGWGWNPFINRTLPRVSSSSTQQDPVSHVPADTPAPPNQQSVQPTPETPTSRLGRESNTYIPLPRHPSLLPGRPGNAGILAARLGRRRSCPFLGDLSISRAAFEPLSGFPSPSAGWHLLLPMARGTQHHPPARQAPAFPCNQAVCRSTPTRSLSPSQSHLDAGLQTAPAATTAAATVAAAAAREGASQRTKEGGGGSPLLSPRVCSSPLLWSPPLRSTAAARPPPPFARLRPLPATK